VDARRVAIAVVIVEQKLRRHRARLAPHGGVRSEASFRKVSLGGRALPGRFPGACYPRRIRGLREGEATCK